MVNYWKAKVLPTIKKVFTAGAAKKAAAAEATKTFDESKEGIDKEFEEKKTELQPKVLEIYEAAPAEIKTLVKKSTPSGLKKNSTGVNKFFEELVKIEFPGSKSVSELTTKFGLALASGPVTYIFEKVAVFLPPEEPEKVEAAVEVVSKEIAVEDVKKEEVAEKVEETSAAAAEEAPAPAAEPAEKPADPEPTPEPAAAAAAAEEEKPAPEPAAEEPAKTDDPAKAAEEPAKA